MKKLLALFVCILLLMSAGCGRNNELSTAPDAPPVMEEPEPEPIYHPLSGLQVDQEVCGRMLVISVDNNPDARPQWGVSQADLLYELPAEGGIPRIVMCFYGSEVEKIGPVRSARPYIISVARGWNGLFVHCGWSPAAKQLLQSGVVDYANEIAQEKYFWRDHDLSAPHNLFTSTELLNSYLTNKSLTTEQSVSFLPFYDESGSGFGETADMIEVSYSYAKNKYIYDQNTQDYARFIDDDPYIDGATGEQVHVSNVIVQRVKSSVLDSSGRLEINMCAGGMAILFTGGKVMQGTWSRDSEESPTLFTNTDGSSFILNRGVTWIQICDDNVTVSWENSQAAEAEQTS